MTSKVDYLLSKLLRSDRLYRRAAAVRSKAYAIQDVLKQENINLPPSVYDAEYIRSAEADPSNRGPIFITARFRSGSTFLWQIFRSIDGLTSYYEPLNERAWFLPQSAEQGVDASHLGVTDYRREYEGLTSLEQYFDPNWSFRRIYMDARHDDPQLRNYIAALIRAAPGRPVLQFNRVDFRLAWLRANFPDAFLVHLIRNPREQWMSIIEAGTYIGPEEVGQSKMGYELFYTRPWALDLMALFPFLDPAQVRHPYVLHYYLWRLSQAFGQRYSHVSVSFESLVDNLEAQVDRLAETLDVDKPAGETLQSLNKGKISERWRSYADEDWFEECEAGCDQVLGNFF